MTRKVFLLTLISSLLIGTISVAGCGGQPPGGATTRKPVPITVELGERATEYDASEAIRSYASTVLGINVTVKSAGGQAGTITLPSEAQESVDAAITLAGATYFGILEDALASVSLGDGEISGNMTADIESASLGVFVMTQQGTLPTSADEALARIKATFPGIANLDYVARPQQGKGYSFQAMTTTQGLDPSSGKVVAVAQSVIASVTPALRQGRVLVWAVVANGTLTKALTF
ncbi:MAG: hypothetical protein WBW48_01650 [Anaerolineae bacterium]